MALDTELLRSAPGGEAVLAWFGQPPDLHDAELLEISVASQNASLIQIHAWNTTAEVDADGYFVREKHALVSVRLKNVSQMALKSFNLPGIIYDFSIRRSPSGYLIQWDSSYGVEGSIHAGYLEFGVEPSKAS